MKIQTKKINSYFHLVTVDGKEIGFLRKAPASRSTITPYQPFTLDNEMIADKNSPSGYAACYGRHAKADAIQILINNQ
jgi:hypothetical protein